MPGPDDEQRNLADHFWEQQCPRSDACERYSEAMGDYHDGRLTPAQAAEVEAHLATCIRCVGELALLRRAVREAEASAPDAAAQISQRLGVTSPQPQVRQATALKHIWLRRLAAAAMILAALAAGVGIASAVAAVRWSDVKALFGPLADDPAPAVLWGNATVFLREKPDTPHQGYVGVDDAVAGGQVVALLKDLRRPGARVNLLTSAELAADPNRLEGTGGLFIIGGPAVSGQAAQVMQLLGSRVQFVAAPDIAADSGFVRRARPGEGLGICDAANRTYPHDPGAATTAALVAVLRVDGRYTILAAGYDGRGTRLAVGTLTHPTDVVSNLLDQFRRTGQGALILAFDRNDAVTDCVLPGQAGSPNR